MKINAKTGLSSLDTTTAPQDIGRENASSFDVYRRLRHDIISCKLKPNARLRFDALRLTYEVGVGTLREALSHLVSDGLVRTEVGRGFHVSPVSKTDLIDITEWRVEFEVKAVVQSIQNGGDDWEAEIVTAFHLLARAGLPGQNASAEVWEAYGAKHERFHNALTAACGSPWLLYFRGALNSQAQRYQGLAVANSEPLVYRNDDEHKGIMEAVLDRDEKKAAKLIEAHIRRTSNAVMKDLENSDTMINETQKKSKSKTKKRS